MIVDVNADGNHIRPGLIYPRVHFKIDMLTGASAVSIAGANPTGWSNERFNFAYLKHFIACQMSGKEHPVSLNLDNH
jgi:hypothetical protein